ncbi:MAG: lipid-A-disaccharide synthase [Lentisphaeria bacterium]|nr:lipid-A-disaccharide synthase [Lentisphaeria bacterium]
METSTKSEKKIWIFAGETSGDEYGALLTKAIHTKDPEVKISGMGAAYMKEAGVDILVDSTELGVVGLIEVLKHIKTFWRIFHDLVALAEKERPDVVVLIDYPGFNLRFAEKMKQRGIKVVYYISPQIWAWHKSRKKKIIKIVDHMMVIFPFEKEVYEDTNMPTTFIGHPLLDILKYTPREEREQDTILLLPGSRFNEINTLFEPMLETTETLHKKHPNLRFVVPAPRETIAARLKEIIYSRPEWQSLPVDIRVGETPEWMGRAVAGIAASGTVTIQAAIMGLPLVVVYKTNFITYQVAKRLLDIPYITMVNLVAKKKVFEEFLQDDVRAEILAPSLESILPGGSREHEVLSGMKLCVDNLGYGQKASENAAEIVMNVANQR